MRAGLQTAKTLVVLEVTRTRSAPLLELSTAGPLYTSATPAIAKNDVDEFFGPRCARAGPEELRDIMKQVQEEQEEGLAMDAPAQPAEGTTPQVMKVLFGSVVGVLCLEIVPQHTVIPGRLYAPLYSQHPTQAATPHGALQEPEQVGLEMAVEEQPDLENLGDLGLGSGEEPPDLGLLLTASDVTSAGTGDAPPADVLSGVREGAAPRQ